jgi:formylmethanofuran dehydrogenase subunit C
MPRRGCHAKKNQPTKGDPMSGYRLTLKHAPTLRIDASALHPNTLATLNPTEVENLPLAHGREQLRVGDLFAVQQRDDPTLTFEGDLSRFDRIACTLADGEIHVRGSVGVYAGAGMSGGKLVVDGDAGDLTGCAMRGGWLEVHGHVGDLAASALPGDMDGMRGGTFVVRGNAGARLADRMRRGSVIVFGDVGDFMASRMVAGTIALAGRCGAHAAYGMRRGSIVFAGSAPTLAPSFVPVDSNADVFWQLLARDLARFGGPFAGLAQRHVARHAGDLAVMGKGELLLPI